ncbi:MAG TPA: hypothetical protein VEZ72_11325 [Paenibacillus sp.]|nr:hypothetical protein [Paenibacillus sp.]
MQADFAPATKAYPAFDVVGLDALRAHLAANGVTTVDDDARQDEGGVRCYANDPFGNRLEFMERR